jgi:FkbM family methyltransferase
MFPQMDYTPPFREVSLQRKDYGSPFEILVSYLYNHLVSAGMHVIDGGANAGLHAVPLATLVGAAGCVTCFEPNPTTVEGLRRNLAHWVAVGTAKIYQAALGNEPGELRFTVNRKRSALSRVTTETDVAGEDEEIITVPVLRLDDVICADRLDFIKLDLEGFDFNGMRGGERLFATSRPPVIFENGREAAARRYGYTKDTFFAWFDRMGYVITDLHNRPLTPGEWTSKELAFEFIAMHREDPRWDLVRRVIHRFWTALPMREEIREWRTCVQLCRAPIDYVGGRAEG